MKICEFCALLIQPKRAYAVTPSIFLTTVFVFLLAMTPGQGFAADSHQVTDAEVQVVSDFFAPYVKTIKKSFYVYNWFNATRSADAQQLLKPISASDVIGYQDVQFMSKLHWSKVSEDRGDVGLGLYGAVDPLISRGFGTMGILGKSDPGDKNWVLTEIRIPVGMRMLNAAVTFENGVPENIMEILDKAKCTQDIRRSRYLRKDLGGKADGRGECSKGQDHQDQAKRISSSLRRRPGCGRRRGLSPGSVSHW